MAEPGNSERRKQQAIIALNVVLGVAIAVLVSIRFKLDPVVTVLIALAVLTALIWGLSRAAKQFEDS